MICGHACGSSISSSSTAIVDLDAAARTIRAEANVPTHSTIFEGHFPGYPLMPGVLLIEAMAQTSGWLVIGLHQVYRACRSCRAQGSEAALLRHARARR